MGHPLVALQARIEVENAEQVKSTVERDPLDRLLDSANPVPFPGRADWNCQRRDHDGKEQEFLHRNATAQHSTPRNSTRIRFTRDLPVRRPADPPQTRAIEKVTDDPRELSANAGWRPPVGVVPPGALRENEQPLPGQTWKRVDWQKLWLATQAASWRSLAVVPAGAMPPDFTLDIAVALARTGSMHLGVPIRVADATHVPLVHLVQFIGELEAATKAGDMILLALGTLDENPTTVSLAQACDQALLCVPLGMARIADAKKVVAQLGARRFLGSAVFHVTAEPAGKR